jgi:hypothetical protein
LEETGRAAPGSGEEECHGGRDCQRRPSEEEAVSAQKSSQAPTTGLPWSVLVLALGGGEKLLL